MLFLLSVWSWETWNLLKHKLSVRYAGSFLSFISEISRIVLVKSFSSGFFLFFCVETIEIMSFSDFRKHSTKSEYEDRRSEQHSYRHDEHSYLQNTVHNYGGWQRSSRSRYCIFHILTYNLLFTFTYNLYCQL